MRAFRLVRFHLSQIISPRWGLSLNRRGTARRFTPRLSSSLYSATRGVAALLLLPAAACADCDLITGPAVVVRVIDAGTGGRPIGDVVVTISDGMSEEIALPVFPSDSILRFTSVSMQPGVYRVRVIAEGYEDFEQQGVSVGRNDCGGIEQVPVTARLRQISEQ